MASKPRPPRRLTGRRAAAAAAIAAAGLTLVSPELVAFLGRWEGTDRKVYADKLAGGLLTGCNGITPHTSPYPMVLGDVWSEERCDEVLQKVVETDQLDLAWCFKKLPPQPVFDAFSSHAHNFGVPATCASLAVGLVNAGHIAEGCRSISTRPDGRANWSSVKTGKLLPDGSPEYRFVQGLHNRRLAETEMCLRGTR